MHKIYFEKRCMVICSPDDQALSDPNAIMFKPGDDLDIHDLVGMVETSGSLQRICIPAEGPSGPGRTHRDHSPA